MKVRRQRDEDIGLFRNACAGDRLELMTCRPVQNGVRVEDKPRREDWTCTGEEGEPIGWFTLFDFNSRNRSAEFGFGLVPAARGMGIARAMLEAAFDEAFSDDGLNKLYCQTASFNLPSVRVLDGLGLTRDGVLRAHHELDGELHDDFIYSLLRQEWQAMRSGP